MPNLNRNKKVLILSGVGMLTLASICLFASVYGINSFKQAYSKILNAFSAENSRVVARVDTGIIHRIVGPPDKKAETTEIDMGGGRHKMVVSRDGKTRDYLLRSEIWREYMDIGGVESVLGSPTSNEYTWLDGKRQNFERGHWLYWSEKTGVVMDYTPFGEWTSSTATTLQVPIFYQGKPMVEWTDRSQEKYHITQDFGVNGHLGQDLAIESNPNPGYEVRPIAEGKVILSGWTGPQSWGYMVLIQHSLKNDRKYYSQYAHLYDFPQVFPGQPVDKRTILGYVGTTGKSTGPHLDIQIKELPEPNQGDAQVFTLEDIGPGYTEKHTPFNGDVKVDALTGIIYYKPSYFITNFNNGAILIGQSPIRLSPE